MTAVRTESGERKICFQSVSAVVARGADGSVGIGTAIFVLAGVAWACSCATHAPGSLASAGTAGGTDGTTTRLAGGSLVGCCTTISFTCSFQVRNSGLPNGRIDVGGWTGASGRDGICIRGCTFGGGAVPAGWPSASRN